MWGWCVMRTSLIRPLALSIWHLTKLLKLAELEEDFLKSAVEGLVIKESRQDEGSLGVYDAGDSL